MVGLSLAGLGPVVIAATAAAGPASTAAAIPGTAPTVGAVSVRDFGALGSGSGDDTAAFAAAISAASGPNAVRYPAGPSGASQGVVYVPAGTYRLLNLTFKSNVRMEVDAGAVLQQAGGRHASSPAGYPPAPAIVLWDGPPGAPLRNVSLVGVGASPGGVKSTATPGVAGWSADNDFTFNLDPQATDANNLVSGLMAVNVDGFLVANVFSIQNDFLPSTAPTTDAGWWPSSRKAALGLRARTDTPLNGPDFYDPHNGTIANWLNVRSPRGFGPNQVNSGHILTFSHIYSQGGTALRFETDTSNQKKFGSEVRSVTADDIAGVNCNRAVSFAPHFQVNYDVHVSNVEATACYQGVMESIDGGIPVAQRGSFVRSSISAVTVTGGADAEVPTPGQNGLWTIGPSSQAFGRDSEASWAVTYAASGVACGGTFQWPSDPIQTTEGVTQPVCTPRTANPTVPSAPSAGSATLHLADASVWFSPATSDGGSPIRNYTVTSSPEGRTSTGTTSPILVPALTAGTSYTFTVHATNDVGQGPESSPSNQITVMPPDAPTGLTGVALSTSRLKLTWKSVARATSYSVLRSTSSSGPYTVVGSTTGIRFTDTGLKPHTTYYYVVQAVTPSGTSAASSPVSVTTLG
ncbi:MAG: hypothetical protein QOG44_1841 [Acidimicrobiaceae bacterium]|nr:hypothetical protein [Acidimicrobiaceae bacterium]